MTTSAKRAGWLVFLWAGGAAVVATLAWTIRNPVRSRGPEPSGTGVRGASDAPGTRVSPLEYPVSRAVASFRVVRAGAATESEGRVWIGRSAGVGVHGSAPRRRHTGELIKASCEGSHEVETRTVPAVDLLGRPVGRDCRRWLQQRCGRSDSARLRND